MHLNEPQSLMSAYKIPVGVLATLLRERRRKNPPDTPFKPLQQNELPQELPAREQPKASTMAAIGVFYAGGRPEKKRRPKRHRARSRSPGRERERERERERHNRDGREEEESGKWGWSKGDTSRIEGVERADKLFGPTRETREAVPYDRPTAMAHAEMGVREDGSAMGDVGGHGGAHMGLGSARPAGPADVFARFRDRQSNTYKEQLAISKAAAFSGTYGS